MNQFSVNYMFPPDPINITEAKPQVSTVTFKGLWAAQALTIIVVEA